MTLSTEDLLREALRKKGIGPKGSKSLSADTLNQIIPLFQSPETNLITGAALLVAFLLLDNTEEEEHLFAPLLQTPTEHFLLPFQALLTPGIYKGETEAFLDLTRKVLQKHDLTKAEAQQAMALFWENDLPAWAKAAFLQGERIKRETSLENLTFYEAFYQKTQSIEIDLPYFIDLCDSYDGSNRSLHLTPFIAVVLGAMGLPTLVHGVESMGPKYGITSAQVLNALNKSTSLSLESAKQHLTNPDVGWAYVDQSVYFPELFALKQLRHDMVKRPFIATIEKLMQPVRNKQGNATFTCYVHSHYREDVVKMLYQHNPHQTAWNLKTIEGSVNCWGKKPTTYCGFRQTNNSTDSAEPQPFASDIDNTPSSFLEGELTPQAFGIFRPDQQVYKGITLEQITKAGEAALKGESSLVADLLIYQAAAFSWLSGAIHDQQEAAERAKTVLASGKAWSHWINFPNRNI